MNQTDYDTELNTIKYIAQENGYGPQLNKILIKDAKQKKTSNQYKRSSHKQKIHNTSPIQHRKYLKDKKQTNTILHTLQTTHSKDTSRTELLTTPNKKNPQQNTNLNVIILSFC